MCLCDYVTESVEAARGCNTGQHAFGKHFLDGLADLSFPVHTLARRP